MAKSKDDIKYGTAQAKLSEDESLRVRYKHGTPLEGGKIADSEPVNLFSSAQRIRESNEKSDDHKECGESRRSQEDESTSQGDGGGI